MSESNERVRISYTVEMGEVPARIAGLIREAAPEVEQLSAKLVAIASSLEEDGSAHTLHNSVDEVRRALLRVDVRLEDVYALLGSYQRALVDLKEQKNNQKEIQSDEIGTIKENE